MEPFIKKILTFLIFFTFVYNINYTLTPLHPMIILGLIGFLTFIIDLNNKHFLIKSVWNSVYPLLFIPVAMIPTIFLNGTDFYYLREYFVIILLMVFAGYFILFLIKTVYPNQSVFKKCLFFIVLSSFIQCVLGLLMFFSPSIKSVLMGLVAYDQLADRIEFMSNFRLIGFGAQFFGLGVINSLSLIIILYLYPFAKHKGEKLLFIVLYSTIFIVGMIMSRTTIIGLILSIVYYVYRLVSFKKYRTLFMRIFYVTIACFVLLLSIDFVKSFFLSFKDNELLSFGFEMIINKIEGGEVSSESTNRMLEMFEIVPDNMSTWIIGDGLFRNPYNKSTYYMETDIGYLRIIFATGIIGLIVYLWVHWRCCFRIKKLINDRGFGLILFLLFVAILFKGIIILYPFFALFYMAIYFDKRCIYE